MKLATDIFLVILFTYIVPMVICAMFAIKHNRDNPFKKGSKSREWVFAPAANVLCAAVVLYYICIELIVIRSCNWIIKRFKEWNKE